MTPILTKMIDGGYKKQAKRKLVTINVISHSCLQSWRASEDRQIFGNCRLAVRLAATNTLLKKVLVCQEEQFLTLNSGEAAGNFIIKLTNHSYSQCSQHFLPFKKKYGYECAL